MEAKYKCKYCGEEFEKPVQLAQHVRAKHKRAKRRERERVGLEALSEKVNKVIEAVGILKGLQVSPNLSDGERKILDNVLKSIEDLISHLQK
ncbi:MAG: C2H2-type zinc finger protein [Candidatus Alkanophagales archaeon]